MSRPGTIILAALALIIFGWFFFADFHQEQPSADSPLFHFNPEKITNIVITDGSTVCVLKNENTFWSLSTSPSDRANTKEVVRLLNAASELKPLNILDPKEIKNKLSLSSLGLQNPKRSLSIEQEGAKNQTLFIGNEAMGEQSLFARMEHQRSVIIIPSTLAELAFRSIDNFRDPHLTSLELDELSAIEVTQGASKLCLKKENNSWQMTQPISAAISPEALKNWITPLFTTEILTRVGNDNQDLSSYGLDQPRATISLLTEDSSGPVTLALGRSLEPEENTDRAVYLRSSARHAIFKVPASLASVFMITPEVLRDRQLFQLNLDTVDRIEIKNSGKMMTLRRQQENSDDWILNDTTPIPAANVDAMVNALEKINVISFQPATPAKVTSTGLDDPSTDAIRFIAHLSENTPDSEAGDHTVMELKFGKIIDDVLFVRIDKAPELLEVPAETRTLLQVEKKN